ncbi:putative toxin-antitoxin system toxin component, PIN family [Flavobacterium sp.]|uniref:putative toxin-antitoxin system toxin component, PIN family n=1 Tax=Flavobacterium sp. TaxID=239 RepID=UPI0025BF4A51|nr:putative toxin-antitoxin system toxin component, PIN family [Flavobacterium sp.]
MPKIKDRVIVDTNLWISFLLSKDYGKLDKLFNAENLILLFSRELLDEFAEVARRPKFKKYFSITDLNELLTEIHSRAEFIDVTSVINLSRDEKDDFLLALAKDGKADFLITGDNDLLELEKFEKTNILTMANYLQKK